MAVGSSIHAQGVAAQKFAGVGSGKYGQTLNLNMSLTSSKYQGTAIYIYLLYMYVCV